MTKSTPYVNNVIINRLKSLGFECEGFNISVGDVILMLRLHLQIGVEIYPLEGQGWCIMVMDYELNEIVHNKTTPNVELSDAFLQMILFRTTTWLLYKNKIKPILPTDVHHLEPKSIERLKKYLKD